MTIDEATKILKDYIGTGPEAEPVEFDTAIALGIEALKEYQKLKRTTFLPIGYLLTGETKD